MGVRDTGFGFAFVKIITGIVLGLSYNLRRPIWRIGKKQDSWMEVGVLICGRVVVWLIYIMCIYVE